MGEKCIKYFLPVAHKAPYITKGQGDQLVADKWKAKLYGRENSNQRLVLFSEKIAGFMVVCLSNGLTPGKKMIWGAVWVGMNIGVPGISV
jgi:hypothetical protein